MHEYICNHTNTLSQYRIVNERRSKRERNTKASSSFFLVKSMSVQILSRRKKAGEGSAYRAGAQQRQVEFDDFFEFRYQACLICKDFVLDVYHRILRERCDDLLEALRNDTHAAASSSGDKLYMSVVSSGLSESDRSHLIDLSITKLENEAMIIQLSTSQESAHDILVEAAEDAYETFRKLYIDPKSRQQSSQVHSSSKQIDELAKSKSCELPIEVIRDVYRVLLPNLTQSTKYPNLIVFLCRNSERIEGSVLSDLMQTLRLGFKSDNVKFVLLLFQSSVCPLPIKLDPSISSLSYVNVHTTISPIDLYDRFIGRILSAREIPVIIPAAYALYLHELFYRSQMCVYTILDRLLLMFKTHFQLKKSVLCMWRDIEWLVNISKGLSITNHFDKSGQRHRIPEEEMTELGAQYINEFLPICDRIDVDDLRMSHVVSMLHYRLFVFSINARDVLLSVGEKRKYSADIIWAAITGRNILPTDGSEESKNITALSLILPQFTECLIRKENLRRIPMITLHEYLQVWLGYLEFPKTIKALSKGIETKCDKIRDDLELHIFMVKELMESVMPTFGMDPNQSMHGWEREMEKAKRLKGGNGDSNCGDIIEEDVTHSMDANENSDIVDETAEGMGVDDATLDFKSDDNPTSYVRDTLLEIGNWLSSTMTTLGEIAQNPLGSGSGEEVAWRAPGILELNNDSLYHFKDLSAGYFRVNLLRALRSPKEYIPSSNHMADRVMEDVCIVHNIITECDRAMALYDCFDNFYNQVVPDEDDEDEDEYRAIGWKDREVPEKFWDSSGGKKRKSFGSNSGNINGKDGNNREEEAKWRRNSTTQRGSNVKKSEASSQASIFTGCKCRFSAAIDLLERYGFIRIIGNGTKIERLVFAWDT